MHQQPESLLAEFGDPLERVEKALAALRQGEGCLVVDDEDRENEGDLVYAADTLTERQMALMIREGSGIVCLCMPSKRCDELNLPPMVANNTNTQGTAFTVSIEGKINITTGVSAADRVSTIRQAIDPNATPDSLLRPGHVYPLRAREGGVLERRGHTETSVDLARLAGKAPYGVICEVTNEDGTMARLPQLIAFAKAHQLPLLSVEDVVQYRKAKNC